MALPQQVLERLSREPPETPGWSAGLLLFTGALLFIALSVYFGLTFGYEPYLQGKIDGLTTQIATLGKSVSSKDEAQLITFYSEVTNLQKVLANHAMPSTFFTWLEKNTEANIYYTALAVSSENKVTLSGNAVNEADINQQIAIFEAAPEVQSIQVPTIAAAQTGGWKFTMTLVMNSINSSSTSQ